jgi:hypothetical protein
MNSINLLKKQRPFRQKLLMAISVVVVVLGLAIGLGVGLTHKHGPNSFTNVVPSPTSTPTSPNNTSSSQVFQPTKGTTWNYELRNPLNNPSKGSFDVWDIDLFDNTQETISSLKEQGAKVICYFSAGSFEDWRPDQSSFPQSDLGHNLDGWAGERWLKLSSPDIRRIMERRLDLAVQKRCDGVDPDNVDGYNNDNGLGLTKEDSIDFMQFLAIAAHQRGLSIGLKNAADIVNNLIDAMQWSVNEQCVEYNECEKFALFIAKGKPVFHVEYPKGSDTNNDIAVQNDVREEVCGDPAASGFSTIIKNMVLDGWIETC